MPQAAPFAEIWRGPFLESVHSGHAVICDDSGQIVEAWGDHFENEEGHATFADGVKCKDDEQVLFSWCEWPDRATRDAAFENMMEDMEKLGLMEMPFDGKRMIFGSFIPVVEV